MISHRRLPAGVLLSLGFLSLASGTESWARKPREERRKEEKPRVRLVADPAVGFTPVTTVLTGQLRGIDPGDSNFCHPAVTWIRIDPGQTEEEGLKIRENPACLHPKEQVFVPTSFTKTWTLYRPGSYLFRLIVEGKDGTQVSSALAKVEVLRVQ